MRIGVVAPVGVRVPVTGYGGLEVAAEWLAAEFTRLGNEVLLFGNVAEGMILSSNCRPCTTGVRLETETDVLSPEKVEMLRSCDRVVDWSHGKFARYLRLPHYRAVVMWTDARDEAGRNIYPSAAVRDAFKDPKGPVVPIGIRVGDVEVSATSALPYLCLGRVAPYKGQDLSIRIARFVHVPLTVAGHTGGFADGYYSLAVSKMCRDNGFGFVPDPPDLNALLDGAVGLLHTHRWIESFSIVAAQALVRGVPILTTDVGAVQEWVRATDGGLVLPLKDLEAGRFEAAGVADFFETNWSSRRAGIAKRARELFDVRVVAERYLELFGADPGGTP